MKLDRSICGQCVIIAVLAMLVGQGCLEDDVPFVPKGFPPPPPTHNPEYSIGFSNGSKQVLKDVQATWVSHNFPWVADAGYLGVDPHGHGWGATDSEQPDPIPPSATISWTTPDGKHHERLMEVASMVSDPKGFAGTIYFRYGPAADSWAVIPLTYEEITSHAIKSESLFTGHEQPATAPAQSQPAPGSTTRPATAPAAGEMKPVEPAKKPRDASAAASRASGEAAKVFDTLKVVHLIFWRTELLPAGDYCESADPPTARFIRACSAQSVAAHDLSAAVKAKFGAKAQAEMQLEFPDAAWLLKEGWADMKESGDPFPRELDAATVRVNGDHASVRSGNDSVSLHKTGGRWRVVFPSMHALAAGAGLAGNANADPNKMAVDCEALAWIDQKLAADVKAGMFKTWEEVRQERQRRREEMGKVIEPKTAPAP